MADSHTIRVLVVDDHPLMRSGIIGEIEQMAEHAADDAITSRELEILGQSNVTETKQGRFTPVVEE
jgi:hypothetical protein